MIKEKYHRIRLLAIHMDKFLRTRLCRIKVKLVQIFKKIDDDNNYIKNI